MHSWPNSAPDLLEEHGAAGADALDGKVADAGGGAVGYKHVLESGKEGGGEGGRNGEKVSE